METTVDLDELRARIKLASLTFIAARLKQAREDSGLSHDAIGDRMGGVTRQHLIKLEQARHRPGPEMLIRFAEATGKPVDFFLVTEVQEPGSFRNGRGSDA